MNERFSPDQIKGILGDQAFIADLTKLIGTNLDLAKADTVSTATGLVWYDLRPVVAMLYPFKELIPLVSRLPRVPGDGGTALHWKRVVGVNIGNVSVGVSEGNRGARIALTEQDQLATYKTLGLEGSATFQARWASKNLSPEALGTAVQATLRSTMIGEEQTVILGNASTPLGVTPMPALSAAGSTGNWGGTVSVFVVAVALSGSGWQGYTPYNAVTGQGGVPGLVNKVNVGGSTDTFGGGSAQPSAEATLSGVTTAQLLTASVAAVPGAVAYAWFVGTATGTETLAGITPSNKAVFSKNLGTSAQPLTTLKVGAGYQDNSTNPLVFDGVISQIYGSVTGNAPGTSMTTNPTLPTIANGVVSISANSGAIVITMNAGNTGLTLNGQNIVEFDAMCQAAWDQYKVPYDRILMSSTDIINGMGGFFNSANTTDYLFLAQADAVAGRIVAGRRITTYMNKVTNRPLDVDVHPNIPPGTVMFWSDRIPYELAGIANVLELHTRQDYYQMEWPIVQMRYEFGVYVDEVLVGYFMPAFGILTNLNSPAGTVTF
jgi:hypothetical protein